MDQASYHELLALVRQVRHDASNPLSAALGHVQLALDEPVLEEHEARRTLRLVEAELRRLTGILRRLHGLPDPESPSTATPPPAP
ncbi:MAG TPA: histidine kinase dimerization/phospho-acceptor domain-containing protein [Longimicrobiales bacterium]